MYPKPRLTFSRRSFLRGILGSTALSKFSGFASALPTAAYTFEEVPSSISGITWVHTAGKSPQKYFPETTGAGCAFIDYDNDGWMDIYLVNSGKADFFTPVTPLRNALYRNNRDGTFTDVTEKAGVPGNGYGMGAAVGDYDGDGFPDLYVTQCGRSILYHNNGDGTFTDVTEKAGVAAPGWASSAVWFDYDNDGRLDLYVGQFAEFSKEKALPCGTGDGKRHYCDPRLSASKPSWLFHNNGDGTFTDVSKESGIASSLGKAWQAVATDINNDGMMDLFVANDTVGNFLFMNRGDGRFEEIGIQADIAYNPDGLARSGMGADSADFNQDGWMDLFLSDLNAEVYSLYENKHDESFTDVAASWGIAKATRSMSGWGLKFFDYDNDGELDLIIANGSPDDLIEEIYELFKYREPLLLFHNDGKTFTDVSRQSGPAFAKAFSGRGLALGDFNNDGAVDVLVSVNDGAPVLLRNNIGKENHWLGVRLVGKKSNPDAIGARLTYQAGDLKRSRMKVGGGGYLSSHDPRIVLGIEKRKNMDWLEIKWPLPNGNIERFSDLPIDRYVTIVEGTGKWK